MEGFIILGAIAYLALWYFIGAEFRRIAAMKGHDEARYFWWTFLLGPVGMLMVIALPCENRPAAAEKTKKASQQRESLSVEDEAALFAAAEETRVARFQRLGEIVAFGRYPTEKPGPKTEISWLVLDAVGKQSLLLSNYALDAKEFHEKNTAVTWENCSLRRWLNGAFCEAAFSEREKGALCETQLDGKKTGDKVFLLSEGEAKTYFHKKSARSCQVTSYAEKQGAYCDSRKKGWWWLRSAGNETATTICVDNSGEFTSIDVDNSDCAVRPAVWVDTDQLSELFNEKA